MKTLDETPFAVDPFAFAGEKCVLHFAAAVANVSAALIVVLAAVLDNNPYLGLRSQGN